VQLPLTIFDGGEDEKQEKAKIMTRVIFHVTVANRSLCPLAAKHANRLEKSLD